MSCTISSPILLPDNIAIIIIPVIIAIFIIFVLIKMNIIKLDRLSIEQSENCAYVDDSSDTLDCKYKKRKEIENFSVIYPLIIYPQITMYPPFKNPSKIKYNDNNNIFELDYNRSSTNITVEYNNDANNQYIISTSYTYRDNYTDTILNPYEANIRSYHTDSSLNNFKIDHLVDNDPSTSWRSLYNIYYYPPNYSGNNYLSENTFNTKGEWIYYKLPKKINLSYYTISSNNNSPRTWIFYGSNDGINWKEIDFASQRDIVGKKTITNEILKRQEYNKNYVNNKFTKTLDKKSVLYQYFGIVITSITDGPGDYCAYVSDIRFFGIA